MGDFIITSLKEDFKKVLNEYEAQKRLPFSKDNEILRFVHDSFRDDLDEVVNDDNYKVKGSVGKGNWSDCPTIAIMDKDITQSTENGYYLVYLFKKNMNGVYLSLSFGSKQFENSKTKMEDIIDKVRKLIKEENFPFIKDTDFNLVMNLESNGFRPKSYEKSSVLFRYYDKNDFPDENTLRNDLREYLEIYKFIKNNYQFELLVEEEDDSKPTGTLEDFKESKFEKYSNEDFLNEVFISSENYKILKKLLANKKNLILQGAPGVGKTFVAKRLAYAMMGIKDDERIEMIQFHQSYSYEDFIEGYRPIEDGYELQPGTFKEFCEKADKDKNNDYFFIIDEINRGNLSKIFGELFMLIETDKRGDNYKIKLLYSKEPFCIPENVHIIGLMNTADRSIAMIDYALRRRFAFFDLEPGFDSKGFKEYTAQMNNKKFSALIDCMKNLNISIEKDESLGKGFRIGHSYLCDLNRESIDEDLEYIINYEIIPLLNEYWFDEPDKVNDWSEKLKNCLNNS